MWVSRGQPATQQGYQNREQTRTCKEKTWWLNSKQFLCVDVSSGYLRFNVLLQPGHLSSYHWFIVDSGELYPCFILTQLFPCHKVYPLFHRFCEFVNMRSIHSCCFHFSANVPIHFIPSVFDHVPYKVGQSEMSLFIQNNIQPLVSAASVNSPFVFFKLRGFTEKLVLPDKTFLFVLVSLCLWMNRLIKQLFGLILCKLLWSHVITACIWWSICQMADLCNLKLQSRFSPIK